MLCMFGRPSGEAVCHLVLCILHHTLMSHSAVEEGKNNKKSGKILIMEGKSKDMLIEL